MHFNQVYETVQQIEIDWPKNEFTDAMSHILNLISFNWLFKLLDPVYDRFNVDINFPYYHVYVQFMTIISVTAIAGSLYYAATRLWVDAFFFLHTYDTTWPEVHEKNIRLVRRGEERSDKRCAYRSVVDEKLVSYTATPF